MDPTPEPHLPRMPWEPSALELRCAALACADLAPASAPVEGHSFCCGALPVGAVARAGVSPVTTTAGGLVGSPTAAASSHPTLSRESCSDMGGIVLSRLPGAGTPARDRSARHRSDQRDNHTDASAADVCSPTRATRAAQNTCNVR